MKVTIRLDDDLMKIINDFIDRREKMGEDVTRTSVMKHLLIAGKSEYDKELKYREKINNSRNVSCVLWAKLWGFVRQVCMIRWRK